MNCYCSYYYYYRWYWNERKARNHMNNFSLSLYFTLCSSLSHYWLDAHTPLSWACVWGKVELVEYFLSLEGSNPEQESQREGYTPLYIASAGGHLEVVKLLVEKCGVAIDRTPPQNGFTPLYAACESGNKWWMSFIIII